MTLVPHTCTGRLCGACRWNRDRGGVEGVDWHPATADAPPSRAEAPARGVCKHLGDDTGERHGCGTCTGKVELKVLRCHVHQRCTVAKAVDGIACCDGCNEYAPLAPPAANVQTGSSASSAPLAWVPVPKPDICRTRDRLVITIAIGDTGRELHALTGPGQRTYADRIGADYVVLTNPTQHPRLPCFEKFRVREYVAAYPGGTVYLDADCFTFPDCPDLLAVVPADRIGLVDIAPAMRSAEPAFDPFVRGQVAALCRSQAVAVPPRMFDVYWNSGVWVGRPGHAAYWTPPDRPVPGEHCDEENWCRRTVYALGLPVHPLADRFNRPWHTDRHFRTWPAARPAIAHLAGMGLPVPGWSLAPAEQRLALLRVFAALAA